ncbi:exonuclease [Salinadaptatus halalkaliphilus]|uniref:Exonuclease n=1 Tax=Salinadaptatus halalkaliphilus TaxID=2419781 RepID=A0A4S3TS94_9EURY|nr:exonuclease [Salinadaptatus halalkaliphilus]THE66560.1 exonuclease [Salinadaptatus halalkaliphilus]
MSTESRPAAATAGHPDVESAGFVRILSRADGDALAASGIVARALAERETPFQVTVGRTVGERTRRGALADDDPDDMVLAIGAIDGDATRLDDPDRPATLEAVDLAQALGATPDPVLALAGLVAAGLEPSAGESEWLLESARERDLLERRPGVTVPTADPIDGLAHSTRLRAPWSGDREATAEALESIDTDAAALAEDDHRAIGSLVALDAVGADDASTHAADAIQRVLKPDATPASPFETIGGYADVLEATARIEPGTGATLAMGHAAREPALEAWRTYGTRTHDALETASTRRYDGLYVLDIDDGPVEGVADVALAYRSPEPTVLVVADAAAEDASGDATDAGADTHTAGETAIATRDPLSATALEQIARALEGELETLTDRSGVDYDVGRTRGYLRYDGQLERSTLVDIVREVR